MIQFEVAGIPKAKGSPIVYTNKKSGRLMVGIRSSPAKDWEDLIKLVASNAMGQLFLMTGPVHLSVTFKMPIPKVLESKLKKGKMSWYHSKRLDLDKMLRLVGDSMNGIVYHDDAQIAKISAHKIYDETPGISVEVSELS
jgi:Holliday junction resolvase RusA-like endonuclease